MAPTPGLQTYLQNLPGILYSTFDLDSALANVHGDIQNLPYKQASFDWIICSHVLEHVPDDKAALKEIRRILKPDGRAILMVPIHLDLEEIRENPDMWNDVSLRWHWFGQDDHLRLYSKKGFQERILSADFTIQAYTPEEIVTDFKRYGISPSSTVYIAQPKDEQTG